MPSKDSNIGRAALFAGETIVPGGSHLLKGDFKNGFLYLLAGNFARAVFGGPGLALVATDSYLRATSGTRLKSLLLDGGAAEATEDAEATATEAAKATATPAKKG